MLPKNQLIFALILLYYISMNTAQHQPYSLHIPSTISRRTAIIVELNNTIPLNRMGMPEGIYRPDLLPSEQVLSNLPIFRHNAALYSLLTSTNTHTHTHTPSTNPTTSPKRGSRNLGIPTLSTIDEDLDAEANQFPDDLIQPSFLFDTDEQSQTHTQTHTQTLNIGSTITTTGEMSLEQVEQAEQQVQEQFAHNSLILAENLAIIAEKELAAAYVPIHYYEGFPAVNCTPYWERLEFEPSAAFLAFEIYLGLPYEVTTDLVNLTRPAPSQKSAVRRLDTLMSHGACATLNYDMTLLQEWFHTYQWTYRARAYDLFQDVARRRLRAMRAYETDEETYKLAKRLTDIAEEYLDTQQEDMLELLTPSAFLDLLKTSVQLRRIASGQPVNGPSPVSAQNESIEGMSDAQIANRLHTKSLQPHVDIDENGRPIQHNQHHTSNTQNNNNTQILLNLMADPASLALVQELVVKMSTSGIEGQGDFSKRHEIIEGSAEFFQKQTENARKQQNLSNNDIPGQKLLDTASPPDLSAGSLAKDIGLEARDLPSSAFDSIEE